MGRLDWAHATRPSRESGSGIPCRWGFAGPALAWAEARPAGRCAIGASEAMRGLVGQQVECAELHEGAACQRRRFDPVLRHRHSLAQCARRAPVAHLQLRAKRQSSWPLRTYPTSPSRSHTTKVPFSTKSHRRYTRKRRSAPTRSAFSLSRATCSGRGRVVSLASSAHRCAPASISRSISRRSAVRMGYACQGPIGMPQRGQRLIDHEAFPTGSHPCLAQQRLFVFDSQQGMQQPHVAPEHLGTLDQALADVRMIGRQPPHQKRPFQVVQIAVHGVIGKRQALADLRSVPLLALHSGEHVQQPIDGSRRRRQPPDRQVALRQQRQVIALPDRRRRPARRRPGSRRTASSGRARRRSRVPTSTAAPVRSARAFRPANRTLDASAPARRTQAAGTCHGAADPRRWRRAGRRTLPATPALRPARSAHRLAPAHPIAGRGAIDPAVVPDRSSARQGPAPRWSCRTGADRPAPPRERPPSVDAAQERSCAVPSRAERINPRGCVGLKLDWPRRCGCH